MEIPKGLCQCGCGKKTTINKYNDASHNLVRGEYKNFVWGHFRKNKSNGRCKYWKDKIRGYVKIYIPEHPRADANKRVMEHVLIVEKALGKFLPDGACVHHVDKDGSNNTPSNLVACQDAKYHHLLHQRQRAYDACGHASWRKCTYCKQYDDPINLHISDSNRPHHKICRNAYMRKYLKKGETHESSRFP